MNNIYNKILCIATSFLFYLIISFSCVAADIDFGSIQRAKDTYGEILVELRADGTVVNRHEIKDILDHDLTLQRLPQPTGHAVYRSKILDHFVFNYALRENENLPPRLRIRITDDFQLYKNFLENYVLDIPRYPETPNFGGSLNDRIQQFIADRANGDV